MIVLGLWSRDREKHGVVAWRAAEMRRRVYNHSCLWRMWLRKPPRLWFHRDIVSRIRFPLFSHHSPGPCVAGRGLAPWSWDRCGVCGPGSEILIRIAKVFNHCTCAGFFFFLFLCCPCRGRSVLCMIISSPLISKRPDRIAAPECGLVGVAVLRNRRH